MACFYWTVGFYAYKEVENMPNNNNQLVVKGAQQAIDQMKYEIASEFGVNLGADSTSRANGSVGGEITKRLVAQAQSQLSGFAK
jgi:Small, acid-soluble spore proteins, alpha/beta type